MDKTDTTDIKKILSLNIKKYRKCKSFSQMDLSVRANLSDQTVNSIESCRLWPSDKSLNKIADALGVEIYKLFVPSEISISEELAQELRQTVKKVVERTVADALGGL